MNNEDKLRKKFEDFSAAKKCPSCGKLSLIFDKESKILHCTSCTFKEPMNKV